ncbi:hypothetical protein ZWY2020_037013 [Hordeum vulgare]|nr:hypothetical protein ZWY2020_037013 [Hordeum vulgare]
MEEAVAAGRTLNQEQKEVMRSKPTLAAVIDELERLRAPLAVVVAEEDSVSGPAAPPRPSASARFVRPDLLASSTWRLWRQAAGDFAATMAAAAAGIASPTDCVGATPWTCSWRRPRRRVIVAALALRPLPIGVSHMTRSGCAHHARLWIGILASPLGHTRPSKSRASPQREGGRAPAGTTTATTRAAAADEVFEARRGRAGRHAMGRAMRWLKKVLTGGKKEGSKDQSTAAPPIERRRWSFAKARSSVADASRRPSVTAVVAGELSQSRPCGCGEAGAAVLIQKAFRGYLARKALRALKSLVKLQALVRGYLVRKQAATTLHRLQALMGLQASSRPQEPLVPEVHRAGRKASLPVAHRRRLSEGGAGDAGFDRSPRIVEMDTCQLRCRSSRIAGRYAADPQAPPPSSPLAYLCKPPSRLQLRELEPRQPRRPEHARLPAVVPSGSPAKGRPSCGGGVGRESSSPRYMADTASSVARGRCQSAPRQRHGHNGAAAPGLARAGSRKAAPQSQDSFSFKSSGHQPRGGLLRDERRGHQRLLPRPALVIVRSPT